MAEHMDPEKSAFETLRHFWKFMETHKGEVSVIVTTKGVHPNSCVKKGAVHTHFQLLNMRLLLAD